MAVDHMLMENDDRMLLESGSGHLILESSTTDTDEGEGGFGAGGEGSGNLAAIAQMYARAQPRRRGRR